VLRYREIKMELQKIIMKMNTGDKLPSRASLGKRLDSSRATIDKAIRELIDEGFLEAHSGSGTYVARRLEGVVADTRNWCLIVPNISENIYAKMASDAERFASEHNTNLILCNSQNNAERQSEYIRRLIRAGVDGFIIVPVVLKNVAESMEIYQSLQDSEIPFVFCNRDVEGVMAPIIKTNDFYYGYKATLHLLDQGYQQIAYLAALRYRTSVERCQGYISALQSRGIEINRKNIIILDNGSVQDCYDALKIFLEARPDVDAVFCFNDSIARKASQAVEDLGLMISDDVGIVGCGNHGIYKDPTFCISSVGMNGELGTMAAEVLYKLIEKKEKQCYEYYLLEPVVVPRTSCLGPRRSRER